MTTETNFDEFKGKDCVLVFKADLYLSLIIYNYIKLFLQLWSI